MSEYDFNGVDRKWSAGEVMENNRIYYAYAKLALSFY